jgi:hypothetical protein
MLGKLYALPNTQLTKRLRREGRLFEDGSTLRATDTEIDQMTSGPNFITTRPRLDVLKDYARVIEHIYDPKCYYERVMCAALNLRPSNKHRPSIARMLKSIRAFLELSVKVGSDRKTGRLYWKTLLTVMFKNPRAVEATVNLAAMFIHFDKQAKFTVELTNQEIERIERCGEARYNQLMLEEGRDRAARNQQLLSAAEWKQVGAARGSVL